MTPGSDNRYEENCPKPGCNFRSRSIRGMEVHVAKCNNRSRSSRSRISIRKKRTIPKRFGGTASRVPCDNVNWNKKLQNPPTTSLTEGISIDPPPESVNLVTVTNEQSNSPLHTEQTNQEERSLQKRQDTVNRLAALLGHFSRRIGKGSVSALMEILGDESLDINLFNSKFRDPSHCTAFVDNVFDREMSDQGFRKVTIFDTKEQHNCELFLRSPVSVLCEQIRKANDSISLEPRIDVDRSGKQCFAHPMSAKLGSEAIPSVINEIKNSSDTNVIWHEDGRKSFVGLGQVYSDKTQSSLRANAWTMYPVHLTLLNFSEEDRRSFVISGQSIIGFLPVEYHSCDSERRSNITRETRMEMLQQALAKIFQELINVAAAGFHCQTEHSVDLQCHFVLASYVCDLPEAYDVLGVKGGRSSFPCHRCYVPRELLPVPNTHKLRSVNDTKKARLESSEILRSERGTKTKAIQHLSKYSLSAHYSFLESFPFADCHPYLDTYTIFSYELLHNIYLGLSVLLKEMCSHRLRDDGLFSAVKNGKGEFKTFASVRTELINGMNYILKCIHRNSPSTSFKVDFSSSSKGGTYNGLFQKDGLKGMLEAKDHRAIDQVMPFLAMFLDRACGEVVSTNVFVQYGDILSLLFRRNMDPGWNSSQIKYLRKKINKFKEDARELYGKYHASDMGTPKFHLLDHVCDDIERLGGLQYGDASYFERAHVSVKERFREGSRRKTSGMNETIVNFQRDVVMTNDKTRSNCNTKKGARFATFEDNVGSLVRERVTFSLFDLHHNYLHRRSESKRQIPFKGTPEIIEVSKETDILIQDIGLVASRLLINILKAKTDKTANVRLGRVSSAFVTGGFLPTAKDVKKLHDGTMAIKLESCPRTVSQRIVSSGDFYGTGKRQDCVLIESDQSSTPLKGSRKRIERFAWVGKVLGLFYLHQEDEVESVAFVQYFDVVPAVDLPMEKLGCVNLQWSGGENNKGETAAWFDIVPLDSIRGVIPVLTVDYPVRGIVKEKAEQKKFFHINRFFFDSAELVY